MRESTSFMENRLVRGIELARLLSAVGRQGPKPFVPHRRGVVNQENAMRPILLTFDVFGTLIDWRAGLAAALAERNHRLDDKDFERVLAAQEADEAGQFRTYTEITAASLKRALGLSAAEADEIAQGIGMWPLYP